MANTCLTNVVVSGNSDSISVLKTIMEKCVEKNRIENGWGNTWLGNLVDSFGEDYNKIACRGYFIMPMENDTDDTILRFETETAWSPMTGVFDMIERHLPDLKVYYIAEECGCELFQTNDRDGLFFKDRYFVDWYTPNGTECPEYFATLEEALDSISEEAGYRVYNTEDVETLCSEWQEISDDFFVYIHEFTEV